MKATIDRIEGPVTVLLVRNNESIKFEMPIAILPAGCKEGDILDINISIDTMGTDEAKKRVASLIEKLKNKNV